MSEAKNMDELVNRSERARETDITLMGDRNVIINVVMLLSYIRNAIKNRRPVDIQVGLNKSIGDSEFEFLVNNTKTDDLIAKESIEIN